MNNEMEETTLLELSPITRLEYFIARAAGRDLAPIKPITRVEKYWAKIAGDDVEVPEPETRGEILLNAIAQRKESTIDPLTRQERWLSAIMKREDPLLDPITRIDFFYSQMLSEPVIFHEIEDGKLIVVGAYSVSDLPEGLYLDCAPDVEWEYPVQTGNVLSITQAYSATLNGTTLEVE